MRREKCKMFDDFDLTINPEEFTESLEYEELEELALEDLQS